MRVGARSLRITHPDKPLFPEIGLTKRDLAEYYRRIAEIMLPYLEGRPVSMERYPDGIDREGFYQKQVPDHFPSWVETARIPLHEGGIQRHVVCADAATLVYLADQACITPHVWLSLKDDLEVPDRLIFDLDPPESGGFSRVVRAAARVRELLERAGLSPFVMLTGSRGVHVTVPLKRQERFDAVRSFARDAARALAARYPDELTTEQRKERRGRRIFLDVARNAFGQTAVPPYAVRVRPGAPVATPVEWQELSSARLEPDGYTVENIFRRLGQKPDVWRDMERRRGSLGEARRRLTEAL